MMMMMIMMMVTCGGPEATIPPHPTENALGWEERQRARLPTRDYMDTTNRIMREKNKLIGELEDIISNYQRQIELMRIELLIRPRLPKPRDDVV